jgi:REase_MTES_1575/Transcriptional regulator, AbiEi antitoxin
MRGELRHDPHDRSIGRIAEAQHGVVSRSQLSELGLGSDAIDHRVKIGRLHCVHRGVYAVVTRPLLTRHGFWMAAVLACQPQAFLSHRAAAALWGIRGGSRTEVTVPRGRKARPGITLHYSNLPADETTTHHGIPVTTISRTLLDISAVLQRHELRSAFRQAEQLRLTDPVGVGTLIERYPRKPGVPTLRAVFEEAQRGLSIIRSELEELFQDFLIRAGLPPPLTNVLVEGMEVDCAWPPARLIVELDGRATHDTLTAFESDRARDRRLEAAGWRVIRITWRQLVETPDEVERDLSRLLSAAPARASRR